MVMDAVRANRRPSQIITRKSIENTIASVAASGGSTNAVLHLLAIAREMGIELSIDDFDAISKRLRSSAISSRPANIWPRTFRPQVVRVCWPSASSTQATPMVPRSPSADARLPKKPRLPRRLPARS